jgi:pimeloyl-ACP methyl ester carboxylesterase
MSQKRVRVLCLHGYRGNAAILREQIRALTRGLPPSVELVFVDAPSLSMGDFGWWHARENSRSPARGDPGVERVSTRYVGWERTRDWLVRVFAEQGPFDGVFGFSQGATLASLLVGLRAPDGRPSAELPLCFGFCVMVGGFISNDSAHASLYARTANFELPSLHIVGRADSIVPSSASHRLALRFPERLVLEHDAGHIIASTPEIRERFADFLERMRST